MRLLVISHTPHYIRDGQIVGWGATVREMDQLATLFEQIVHIAPLHDQPAPASALPYSAANITLHPVQPGGGPRLADKAAVLARLPAYARAILQERRRTDTLHIRCPAHISLLALILLAAAKHPQRRWVKYAGNWQPGQPDPWSYRFQRWWLARNFTRAVVTVNGHWKGQPEHVITVHNPCMTDRELAAAEEITREKQPGHPVRLLFVGRLEPLKGVGEALEIAHLLKEQEGLVFQFDLVGDGPDRPLFEQMAVKLSLTGAVRFRGWVSPHELGRFYADAHFLILPSHSEGWPKVIGEAMAYGVVPLAGKTGSIPETLATFQVGQAIPPANTQDYVNAIMEYINRPVIWQVESGRARQAARELSYTRYLEMVRRLVLADDHA